ncbi:CPA1 family monovalent cation:H+ antiporter [Flavobacterium sp. 7E]|uniref:cation:proton antiporter n=1 Tax=unclassified Flavobacterium TaxID=196869 RepID=UPI00156F37B6|nr:MULTISPECIES: sodium:proton antiporter [unclassified Flavobacterium]NRS90247.1 CPA1 family monovalent cation:H+ antiporter [Flavobacterium sp. 7E]NRT14632.1 CPA1 family monovalent cation:H+ antiporter [Flavobacterium sp. 28A]
MDFFHLFSVLIVLSAGFAYINFRILKLPNAIGLMFVSLIFSFIMLILGYYFPSFKESIAVKMEDINFSELLLEGMLSFMLFAGAIHIKFKDLNNEKLSILLFSTISVLISTFVIGFASFYLLNFMGIKVELIHAMLFGALISPTDPIAVLSILKTAGVTKSLETKIAGESLFNDGVAVVVFITILKLAKPGTDFDLTNILMLFGQEAIGGLLLGVALGYIGYKLIASIDNYQVEVLITLAIVMGGYTFAHYTHVSGPLAMVAAGLITGNQGKSKGMSDITAEYIDKFWELIDEILNAVLFVLIGLELLIIQTNQKIIIAAVILLFITLITRYISVYIPSIAVRLKERITQKTILILTWGGLRGGISIALALSIAPEYNKDIWVTITYVIVCFSILVQGMTIGKFAKKMQSK